jgi:D-alanyl-D-alanine carboxypeptidase/D-alanyl-D-alanine-endopeptidase (penicillin-binding protein 4)
MALRACPWRSEMRILFLCGLLFCAAAVAQERGRLPPAVTQALTQAGIPETAIGLYVQEAGVELPLLAVGEGRALNPASTIKLLTTFAALDQLGPAYQWTTEVFASAPLQGEILAGDLILRGGGDPRLTLENFWLMLRNLRARGLREIRGDLVLDRSLFAGVDAADPGGFDNEPTRPYNTQPDALLVNFKSFRLTFMPDTERRTVRIAIEPALSQVQIVNNLVLDGEPCGDWVSRLKLATTGDTASARLVFGGNFALACGEKERHYSLLGHAQYVHALFTLLWRELGGNFAGAVREGLAPAGAKPLLTHVSQPLTDVVRDINKFSNNVMARQLFLTLGTLGAGAPASAEKSARAIRQWTETRRLGLPELVLENGSGLSRSERISARGLAQLLLLANRSAMMPEYVASLPLVAIDGTMRKRLTGADIAGQAHIKTGSLAGARAIAGYVLDARGRLMIVVFMVNHARAAEALPAQDALLKWVHAR